MPNPAQFVSFLDEGFTVPPRKEVDDQDDPGIPEMGDLFEPRDGFLAFKYRTVDGSGTLSVKFNDVQFKEIPFGQSDRDVARVWFETIVRPHLHVHNKIVINVGGSGHVHVSDFKIFYHMG